MADLENLYILPGFTGTKEPGVRRGSEGRPFACSSLASDDAFPSRASQVAPGARRNPQVAEEEESDEEDEAVDEENQYNLDTVVDWWGRMSLGE